MTDEVVNMMKESEVTQWFSNFDDLTTLVPPTQLENKGVGTGISGKKIHMVYPTYNLKSMKRTQNET